MNIAVLGGGSWATAVVKILLTSNDKVFWWVREKEIKQSVEHLGFNELYLRYCELDSKRIDISNDIHYIIKNADILFFVIPAAFLYCSIKDVEPYELKGKKVVTAIKGIVPEKNNVVSEFFRDSYGIDFSDQAVISGPSHAEEIAAERLTYLTCGSVNKDFAQLVSSIITCRFVKTTLSDDILGIEYAAVLKNIYALAAGLAKGAGYGDNFIAVLISNSLQEMDSMLNNLCPQTRNIKRLAYLGDLLVTAYSQHSRNRTFGQMIGQGYSLCSAQLEMKMIAEGYYSAKSINNICKKKNINLPIANMVYHVLYEKKNIDQAFKELENIFN